MNANLKDDRRERSAHDEVSIAGTYVAVPRVHREPTPFPSPELPSLPIVQPDPPRLTARLHELVRVENSGVFSNYGPVNTELEREFVTTCFGYGACLTVSNATIGLMLAIGEVIGSECLFRRSSVQRFALMPSFTFAAAAHAALWCGLTPLFCDIDPETWLPDAAHEKALLERYKDQIAVVVPYATFGNNLDLERYEKLSRENNVPIVVDAAASLGCRDAQGQGFGAGFSWPVVFSMHATKPFSVGEGGLIYCADEERIARLRAMSSFGFEQPRTATLPGLNAKMSEINALTALQQLRRFPSVVEHRQELATSYKNELPEVLKFQSLRGSCQVRAFESVLLPKDQANRRKEILQHLQSRGIGTATYFSPHLAEQPLFREFAEADNLPVTEDIASRIISLPLLARMSTGDAARIGRALAEVLESSFT